MNEHDEPLMTVYRIENEFGDGPYNANYSMNLTFHEELHPFVEDEGGYFDETHLFGFDSMGKLERWFTPDLIEQLEEEGSDWAISIYEVDIEVTMIVPSQMTFDPHAALFITRLPLTAIAQQTQVA